MKYFWVSSVCLLLSACAPSYQAVSQQSTRIPNERVPVPLVHGTCRSSEGSVSLESAYFIENRTIETEDATGGKSITLRGQSVIVRRLHETTGPSVETLDAALLVANEEDNLDLSLQFAIVEGEIAIYWRETFQNRSVRQGLLRIVDDAFARWCEGRRGIDTPNSH